jgi:hypothetical protein
VQLDRAVMGFDLALVRCFRLGAGRVRRFFLRRDYPLASPLRPLVLPLSTCAGVRCTLLRPLHISIFACLRHLGSVNASAARRIAVQSLCAGRRTSLPAPHPLRSPESQSLNPKALPTTGTEFPLTEHANLQLALDAVLVDAELLGFATRPMGFGSSGLAEIVAGDGMTGPVSLGPVRYVDVEVGAGRAIQCVKSGLF